MGWTTKRAVWLKSKVLPREAPGFPRRTHLWGSIPGRGRSVWRGGWSGRSKLGRAHCVRFQLMAQFQAQVPHPLGEDLPDLLPVCRLATPAVRVLFLVFIGKRWFKCAAMQIQSDHVTCGKSWLGEVRQEQFVDDALAGYANPALLFRSRMRRHDDPTRLAGRANQQIRDVVERPHHATFRMLDLLIWRQMQARLDLDAIEQAIVFATGDIRQSCRIRKHGSCPILAI